MHVENNVNYASNVHEKAVLTVFLSLNHFLNGYKTPLEVIPDTLQLYASNFCRTESHIIKNSVYTLQ